MDGWTRYALPTDCSYFERDITCPLSPFSYSLQCRRGAGIAFVGKTKHFAACRAILVSLLALVTLLRIITYFVNINSFT